MKVRPCTQTCNEYDIVPPQRNPARWVPGRSPPLPCTWPSAAAAPRPGCVCPHRVRRQKKRRTTALILEREKASPGIPRCLGEGRRRVWSARKPPPNPSPTPPFFAARIKEMTQPRPLPPARHLFESARRPLLPRPHLRRLPWRLPEVVPRRQAGRRLPAAAARGQRDVDPNRWLISLRAPSLWLRTCPPPPPPPPPAPPPQQINRLLV